jgi:hypothetical protein
MRCFLFLSAFAAALATVGLKDCSSGTSVFTIKSLSFSPDAPIGGQNGTLHTIYEVPNMVSAGNTRYSCSLNGLPVYDESFDLCSQTACPINIGTHDDYSTSEVPDVSGKVVCKIEWTDTAGAKLLCIQTTMTLSSVTQKNLRGKKVSVQYHTLLGTNLSENATCPRIDSYDPDWHTHETLDYVSESPNDKALVIKSNSTY